ncbi:NAD(P)/FAD-dependent oxidoreductase [Vibrio alginolyticus]|uniref:NAD(P)/FAD-dependent oxidoreductase n=1 Tax=Vibrio TaxID=662 RepID=UPI0000D52EED|nr:MULTISPECIES: FAD-dependent oxidoreductase [Vibrio]EAS77680.1 D-amino acid dehydrogenase, small subunit [Vibrio alginolyticus 12G01]MCS0151438.1 FAD-binding oxidoreductase [Vibrio alginolyticus]MDW1798917.1 FAD-dependent oxidoreductase [Vibrio sp. Vb2201]MDW2191039.1 FAD-dependent oxidoreductase [Vibrio sp. 1641]NNN52878.1 FAD-binding oxidoreductase [Vibrio sp. 2-2(7)]
MLVKDETKKERIAVIGAGIIGLSIGLKLQQQGYQVTIFDPNGVGNGCSKGNAGHIATEQIFPLATPALLPQLPKMLLDPKSPVSIRWQDIPSTIGWMIRFLLQTKPSAAEQAKNAIKTLNERSVASWRGVLDSIGKAHLIKMNGSLLTFENEKLFKDYQSTLNSLAKNGVAYQVWTQEAIRKRIPDLSHKVRVGVFFPDTGHTLDPYQICVELSEAFEALGGKILQKGVSALEKNGDVLVESQTHSFDRIIVAAGVHSKPLIRQLTGVKVPIQAERGYHLMVDDKRDVLPFPISSADRKFIMTPMSGGLRLAGTVEYADVESPPNMKRSEMLFQLGDEMFESGLNPLKQGEKWMGNRPSTVDSLPVIDSIWDGNVLLAFGHQHLGLTQAAITADLLLELIEGKPTSIDLSPFSLQRFA